MARPRLILVPVLRALRLAAGCLALPLALGLAPLSATPENEKIAYLQNLPEANPYRAALLRLAELPPEQRRTIADWINHTADQGPPPALEAAQLALVHQITASVVAANDQPAATAALWPPHPSTGDSDNLLKRPVPPLGAVRELARLTVRAADTLPPGEALHAYAAVAQLARQQRAGNSLIEQIGGIAIEGLAFSAAARRLNEFSPDELRRLSAAWSRLHDQPTLEQCFAGERDQFYVPIVETIIRPGLHALAADPSEADRPLDPDAGFTQHLRLSGLIDYGNGRRAISLEDRAAGVTFTLREGGPAVDEIRLLSIDFEQHQAVIRRGNREAIIHLESKQIVEQRAAAEHLLTYFGDYAQWTGDGTDGAKLKEFLAQARAYPGGIDAYADELIARYDRALAEQIATADSPRIQPEKKSRAFPVSVPHRSDHRPDHADLRQGGAHPAKCRHPAAHVSGRDSAPPRRAWPHRRHSDLGRSVGRRRGDTLPSRGHARRRLRAPIPLRNRTGRTAHV